MSQALMNYSDFVVVPRPVMERLQAQAALGAPIHKAREFVAGGAAAARDYVVTGATATRDYVVTEAKAAPSTAKSMVAPIGVGALLAFVATMDDVKNSKTVKEYWWALPAALLAVGYILRRKESPHANAVLAAGAVLFVQAYRSRPKKEEEKTASTPPKKEDTAGPTFAAPPMMHPIDDRTAWIQSGGQWVRVQIAAPVRPALPMQADTAGQPTNVNDPAVALAAAAFAA